LFHHPGMVECRGSHGTLLSRGHCGAKERLPE
jgi:hypothetical protein